MFKQYIKQGSDLKSIIFSIKNAKFIIPSIIVGTILVSFLNLLTLNQEVKANNNELGVIELAIYISIKLFCATMTYVCGVFSMGLVSRARQNAKILFFTEYIKLNFVRFYELGIGSISCAINRRSNALTKFLQILFMRFIINAVCLCVILYKFAIYISLSTIIKALSILAIFFVFISIIQYNRARLRTKINTEVEKTNRKIMDILINYERIKAYNNQKIETKKLYDTMEDMVFYNGIFDTLYDFLSYLTTIAFLLSTCTIYYCLNYNEKIEKTQLQEIFFVAMRLNATLYAILQDLNRVYTSYYDFQSTDNISAIEDETKKNELCFHLHKHVDKIEVINLNVVFDDVKAIKNVNCVIEKGDKIAICGPSSSGKSVFLKSILGVYGYKGAIIFDGYEQKQISQKSLVSQIAYIPQDVVLFDKTIMENLKLGNESMDDEKVLAFCEIFRLHNTFKNLGYNKKVGSLGKNLSGGQRQKVIFMRTILKQAPVLLMDQAMSALDIQTERFFIETMKSFCKNSTILFVTKNTKALGVFDKIFFFDEGNLAGTGNLKFLLNNNEKFAKFYYTTD
ncbi:ABCB7 [Ecytonucleospora hepatopenaei]|uniref:ABCB7 n=1 Tax=Ecytonucleospora hepatopenaei TaxID=646526 RepID=A0A1W0E5M8_9MICR|nr:ABCB7 [Ecytonucleospora hepatopenaei]